MSQPQPFNISNFPEQNPGKSWLQETGGSKPDIKELIAKISRGNNSLQTTQDSFLSIFISSPNSKAQVCSEIDRSKIFEIGEASNQHYSKHFMLYEFYNRHVSLSIYSVERYLSSDQIQGFLTVTGQIYWGYSTKNDGALHGYFGAYYPTDDIEEVNEENAHTYFNILWPRHTKIPLLNRLRILAQEGADRLPFWGALVGSIAAADEAFSQGKSPRSVDRVTSLPAIFATLMSTSYQGGQTAISLDEIENAARFFSASDIRRISQPLFAPQDLDVCGTAIFLQKLGKCLWTPTALRASGWVFDSREQHIGLTRFFSHLADYWISLVSFEQIDFTAAGMEIRYNNDGDGPPLGLWKQAIEFEFWQISPEALRYLQRWQHVSKTTDRVLIAKGYDPAYGNALAEKLLSEAHQNCAYVPSGAFRTVLPAGMPIAGIEELCIWAEKNRLWVLPRPYGSIFCWYPDIETTMLKCGRQPDELSAWRLILSALWHDLVTEGTKVIVRTSDEQPAPGIHRVECKSHKRHRRSRPNTHVLRLPSQRVIYMDGVHTWGTPEEIEKIQRQAHQVRGHRRKLLPGQKRSVYAQENAQRFNFIVPDGYTFVKPYQTGLSDPDAPAAKETPILARGLASLMLMSKDYSKGGAA